MAGLRGRLRPRAWFCAWRDELKGEVAGWPDPVAEVRAGWARATPPIRFAIVISAALALPLAAVGVALIPMKVIDATSRATDMPAPRPPVAVTIAAEPAGRAPAAVREPEPAVPDPLAGQPPASVAWLTAPTPDAPQPVVLFPYVTPATFCTALARAGLPGAVFRMDEPPQTGWTCVTDLIKPIPGDDADMSSLFVSARGLTSDTLSFVRFKLNLLDREGARLVKRQAREALRQVFVLLGFRAEEGPLRAIDALDDQKLVSKGLVFELRREFGTPLRVNMVVTFPRTLGGPAAGVFTPVRRPLLAPVRPADVTDDAAAPL